MNHEDNSFIIKKIYWERIFLNIEIEAVGSLSSDVRLFLSNGENTKIPVMFEEKHGIMCVSLNVACVEQRNFLENGRWYLLVVFSDKEEICQVSSDVAYKFEELSRVFKYAQNQMAYTISFGVFTDDEVTLKFYIDSYFMIENNQWKRRRYVKEVRGIKSKIKRLLMYVVIIMIRIYYHILDAVIMKKNNRILIMSETKDYLWGNLKFIDEKIKERGLDKKYKVTYSFRSAVGKQQSIKDCWSWVKIVTKIAAQDYVFVDDYAQIFGFFKIGKKTKLIQVWHAGEGFKSVGYSRFGKDGSPFPTNSCHRQYTHVITGSEHLVRVFQEVFAIEKEAFYPVGMPRLDGFLDEEKIRNFKEEFYDKYKQLKGKKIILFAPTYRGTEQKKAYYDYSKLDLEKMAEFCKKENYIFLIKMHPFVKQQMEIPEKYTDYLIDFTKYPNINDLYYVTDILVTDYSSNYFEYALLKRPVIFFTYDRVVYELTRGVHRSIVESAPGKVCDTFDEFMKTLEKKDFEIEKIEKFVKDNFDNYTGNATDMVIDSILLNEKRSV